MKDFSAIAKHPAIAECVLIKQACEIAALRAALQAIAFNANTNQALRDARAVLGASK